MASQWICPLSVELRRIVTRTLSYRLLPDKTEVVSGFRESSLVSITGLYRLFRKFVIVDPVKAVWHFLNTLELLLILKLNCRKLVFNFALTGVPIYHVLALLFNLGLDIDVRQHRHRARFGLFHYRLSSRANLLVTFDGNQ